ncbi:MAG: hypothetical protein ABI824_03530 [Acidobacteriota bacterium]
MRTPRILILLLFAIVHLFAVPVALTLKLPPGAKPTAIEVGSQGDVYLVGSIWSAYPNAAIVDSFVARYDPRADQMVYVTQFGVAATFTQNSLAVDAAGAAYLTGDALSAFPLSVPSPGPTQPISSGSPDAVVLKIGTAGRVIYATRVPNSTSARASGIAVNAAGEVYLTGTATGLTVTPGAAANRTNSRFVMKLDVTGSNVLLTELGIGGVAITLDEQQNIYVAGTFGLSLSNPLSLVDPSLPPVTPNVFQHDVQVQQCGASFAFAYTCAFQHVAKLDPTGSKLLYGLFLAGSLGATPSSLAVDAQGDLFITGYTPSSNYPVTAGAVDAVYRAIPEPAPSSAVSPRLSYYTAPPQIGFVTELNPDASNLVFSTYLGGAPLPGSTTPFNTDVIRDPVTKVRVFNDRAYVTGIVGGTDFPGLSAVSPRCLPTASYLFRIGSDGKSLEQAQSFPLTDANQVTSDAGSYPLISSFAFDAQGIAYQVGPGAVIYRVDPSVPDSPGCTADSATFQITTTTAPGELLSVFGNWPVSQSAGANSTSGLLPTTLANMTVDFDGIPGRLLYSSSDQINVMVPFEIAGRSSTTMNVRTQGGALQAARTLTVMPRRPSAFTYDLVPGGCGPTFAGDDLPLARNPDGTFNSCSNPATSGSIVTLYLNGGGIPGAHADSGGISPDAAAVNVAVTAEPLEVVNFSFEKGSVSGVWRLDVKVPGPATGVSTFVITVKVDGVALQNRRLELYVKGAGN